MTRTRILLAASGALLLAAAPAAAGAQGAKPQYIHLSVSTQNGEVSGSADLTVVRSSGGFRISGTVTNAYDSDGCVTLKAVEMHFGSDFGGNTITKACKKGQVVRVRSTSRHHSVVLQVDEPGSVDFESRIVTLTGKG